MGGVDFLYVFRFLGLMKPERTSRNIPKGRFTTLHLALGVRMQYIFEILAQPLVGWRKLISFESRPTLCFLCWVHRASYWPLSYWTAESGFLST